MYNQYFNLKKILLAVASSLTLASIAYANSSDSGLNESGLNESDTVNTNWNCQKIDTVWRCLSRDESDTMVDAETLSIGDDNTANRTNAVETNVVGKEPQSILSYKPLHSIEEESEVVEQVEIEQVEVVEQTEIIEQTPNNQDTGEQKLVEEKLEEKETVTTKQVITEPTADTNLEQVQTVGNEVTTGEALISNTNIEQLRSPINTNICFEQDSIQYKSNSFSNPNLSTIANKNANEVAIQNSEDPVITIEADNALGIDKNQIDFSGNVIISRDDQHLISDQASYNKEQHLFTAQGNIEVSQPGVIIAGDQGSFQSEIKQGQINNSTYVIPQRPAQGKAKHLTYKPGQITLTNPSYSSCPANEEDWVLKASEMNLYTEEGYGDGQNVVVYFKGIPFIYTPYLRFPLNDERTSGLLLPEVAYSSNNGLDISAPYYWNIAPNMDATITPRVLSKRGLMLGSEFRFLSEKQAGQVYAEYINDSHYDDDRDPLEVVVRGSDISSNRGAFSGQHQASLSQNWKSNIDFNYVSDNYYIDDFGNNLTDRSESHLVREGKVYYSNSYINFSGRVQGYQELKENVNTYSRLPQFLLSGYNLFEPADIPIGVGFTSEAVSFAKNWDYDRDADEGQRYNIRPYIEMPYNRQYGYIKPKLSFDLINYSLDDTKIDGADTNFNRATPIVSIDSGLFFEKELSLFNTGLTQTLEPRLYYLYVPYRDQNLNPLFDTSSNTFSFDQLFRDNRFSGVDRIGDANQLTYALTSRFYDNENGFERFRASLGQIVYFKNRDVQLGAFNEDDETASSAIAGEIASEFLPSWNTSFSMLYDPHNSIMDTSNLRLQYKSDAYHILNLDYTYKNDGTIKENYEQIDVSAYWKIAPKWRALAQYNYSLQESFNLESMVGVEYDSCCYAFRLVVGREQAYASEDSDIRVMLQMQFKGLASLGNISDKILSNDIPGFENIMSK